MAGDPHARAALERFTPHTHVALQHFVMAMADVVKNTGKKTFFGKDKGIAAMEKLGHSFVVLKAAMQREGQTTPDMTVEDIAKKVETVMGLFSKGYPNWQDAYLYFAWLTTDNRQRFLHLVAEA